MHKGVILLVKSDYEDCVRGAAEEFMEQYQDSVWDWFEIGGRWSGTLAYQNSEQDQAEMADIPEEFAKPENDVMLLSDCFPIVKEWSDAQHTERESLELAEEQRLEDGQFARMMYGYYLHRAGELVSQRFCFDTNVFNTEEYDYSVPEDLDGWYAVMIDMHN